MHWGPAFLGGRDHQNKPLGGVNAITTSAYCPTSKQPELKHAAVKVLKAELPWTLLAVAWLPEDSAHTVLQALRARMAQFEFASCVPFAESGLTDTPRQGVLLRAACSEPPDMAVVQDIEQQLGLSEDNTLRYVDAKHSQLRCMRLRAESDTTLDAFVIAGDTSAEAWLKALLQTQQSAKAYGRRLLMTGHTPPVALVSVGSTVCTCVGVSDVAIQAQLAHSAQPDEHSCLSDLQATLKCGTQCGSCVPELRRMIRLHLQPEAATPSLAI
jgi:assimilatory nitrate reductase catalytic subunit